MKIVKTVQDTVTFTLHEADLTGMKIGEKLSTPKRDVFSSNGLQWWISYYPAGESETSPNFLSIFFNVNKAVSAKYNLKVGGTPYYRINRVHNFYDDSAYGYVWTHEELRPLFTDGQLTVTCIIEFGITVPFSFLTTRMVQFSDGIPTDFEFIVELDRVKVHKGYISLISPVINAMLSHDTAESRSNTVKITDFDYETVKAAVDFCYGREPEVLCVDTIVGVLRFADKYDIQAVTDDLSMIPLANLSPETFATIAHYAYDCSKDDLFQACCKYFKKHQSEIVTTKKFTALAPSFVVRLLQQTFNLKTQFGVLRYAYANGLDFIMEPLEQLIIESLALDTFCVVVEYAWDCSRDDLKNACGKFFNDYQAEITRMKEFYDLPPNVVYEVLKKGYDVL